MLEQLRRELFAVVTEEDGGRSIGSVKARATLWAVIRDNGMALVSFEYLSLMTSRNLFPRFVRNSGPRMSMETYSRGPLDGNNCKRLAFRRSLTRLRAHDTQFFTVIMASTLSVGQ